MATAEAIKGARGLPARASLRAFAARAASFHERRYFALSRSCAPCVSCKEGTQTVAFQLLRAPRRLARGRSADARRHDKKQIRPKEKT
jgi:NADH:ubiquinone oxidoreductase subunit F (NADH-binding)